MITSVNRMLYQGDSDLKIILRSAFYLAVQELPDGNELSSSEIELLVDKYHNYLLALLRFKTGDHETAKDLLQDTYLSFLGAVSKQGSRLRFKNETKIKNYLITIALNKVKNYYKKTGSERAHRKIFGNNEEMEECLSNIISTERVSIEKLVDEEKEKQLKAATALAMERLSSRYRTVLDYKFSRGYDNPQIAGRMNIGIKAAESLLFRAKAAFKKEFRKITVKENGFFEDEINL